MRLFRLRISLDRLFSQSPSFRKTFYSNLLSTFIISILFKDLKELYEKLIS